MSEGPAEVFEAAGTAVDAGDWLGLFQRLTPASIERVAGNTVIFLLGNRQLRDEALVVLEGRGDPTAPVHAAIELQERILASAEAMIANSGDPAAMMEASKKHRLLVKEHDKARKGIVKSWKDRPASAAALERLMRARTDGGSVSSTLFVGETLSELEIGEKKARAVRIADGQEIAPLGFERRRDGWLINLFAK